MPSGFRPAALELESSSYKSASHFSSRQSPPLLYNAPPMSPPTSPTSSHMISPTSPSFPPKSGRTRSPHSPRNRSLTPVGVTQSDLEQFADYCRNWYFNQDDSAGRLMTQTMASLPQSSRAPYSRLQAAIRSAYHRSINARKTAEFSAHLSVTQSGGSLLPHSRAHSRSKAARKERYERFHQFIRTWCAMGMPGPQPFFQGLWAVMRLQVLPKDLGGAGANRIEWEIDDAVFKESAGKDFMVDSIDILKGVLGFEEVPATKAPSTPSEVSHPNVINTRAHSQPLPSDDMTSVTPKRARAPSDPFLDTPTVSRSHGASSQSSGTALTSVNSETFDIETSPRYVEDSTTTSFLIRNEFSLDDPEEEETTHIWTSTDLTNAEYLDLLSVFPSFVSQRTLPRFQVTSKTLTADVEQGLTESSNHVRCGTGLISLSLKERSDGWEGSWFTRFILWLRRTFC